MRFVLATLLIAVSLTARTLAQQELPLSDGKWVFAGERTAVVKDSGRDVLQIETGRAERRDVRFENGTIEFDVQVTRRRSFVYVYFRIAADGYPTPCSTLQSGRAAAPGSCTTVREAQPPLRSPRVPGRGSASSCRGVAPRCSLAI
jgi:hypothetical protein